MNDKDVTYVRAQSIHLGWGMGRKRSSWQAEVVVGGRRFEVVGPLGLLVLKDKQGTSQMEVWLGRG